MLSYFNWNLCLPTAHYTTALLLPHSLQPSDLHNGGPLLSFTKAADYLEEYIQHFSGLYAGGGTASSRWSVVSGQNVQLQTLKKVRMSVKGGEV